MQVGVSMRLRGKKDEKEKVDRSEIDWRSRSASNSLSDLLEFRTTRINPNENFLSVYFATGVR